MTDNTIMAKAKKKKKAPPPKDKPTPKKKPFGYVFGRPSGYRKEYCDLSGYLDQCKDKEELPTKCGYACFIGVCEDTLTSWGSKYPDFLGSLRELINIEKRNLLNKGLAGTYNSTIAKLVLSANHGMKERIDATSDDKPLGSVVVNVVPQVGTEAKEIELPPLKDDN